MKPPTHIEIDTREQSPWTFGPDVVTSRVTIPHGDYRIRGVNEAVIEKKSLPDFIGSFCSAERQRELRKVVALSGYAFAAYVIEGSAEDVFATAYRSLASPESVWATALSLQVDHGVHVVWAGDRDRAAKTALWLLRRYAERAILRRNVAARFAMWRRPRRNQRRRG